MPLSHDDVRRLAHLARLAIRPDEAGAVLERLNRVLGMIDDLRAVDTAGIEPMTHALDALLPGGQRAREDAVTETDCRALYQSSAPAVDAGLYLVPKVID